jgi:putative addiction module CopG family antidote
MRKSKPLTVTLGNQQRSVDRRVESGLYESASEVIRAAIRALDREEAAIDEIMRQKYVPLWPIRGLTYPPRTCSHASMPITRNN